MAGSPSAAWWDKAANSRFCYPFTHPPFQTDRLNTLRKTHCIESARLQSCLHGPSAHPIRWKHWRWVPHVWILRRGRGRIHIRLFIPDFRPCRKCRRINASFSPCGMSSSDFIRGFEFAGSLFSSCGLHFRHRDQPQTLFPQPVESHSPCGIPPQVP